MHHAPNNENEMNGGGGACRSEFFALFLIGTSFEELNGILGISDLRSPALGDCPVQSSILRPGCCAYESSGPRFVQNDLQMSEWAAATWREFTISSPWPRGNPSGETGATVARRL